MLKAQVDVTSLRDMKSRDSVCVKVQPHTSKYAKRSHKIEKLRPVYIFQNVLTRNLLLYRALATRSLCMWPGFCFNGNIFECKYSWQFSLWIFHTTSLRLFPLVLQPLPLPALLFYNLSALKNEEAIATVGHESLENNVIFKVQGISFFLPWLPNMERRHKQHVSIGDVSMSDVWGHRSIRSSQLPDPPPRPLS